MPMPDVLAACSVPHRPFPLFSFPPVSAAVRFAPECKAAGARRVIAEDGGPADRVDPAAQARCRIALAVVEEIVDLVGERRAERRDRRRMMTHVRQIAMYVSHVVLQISLTDIGVVFGRDRTTVRYACHVVEDRRDDTDFDAFIAGIERVVAALLGLGDDARG